MIRIERGPEPSALETARRRGLARVVLARRRRSRDPALPRPHIDGYDAPGVREQLYAVQHAKCVYCERPIGRAGQPIEHFHPKGRSCASAALAGQ
jgi:hypothetical protein